MQDYSYTVPPNGALDIVTSGTFVRCLDATAPWKIAFDNGQPVYMAKGAAIRLSDAYNILRLINPTGAPNLIQVVAGTGDYQDDRLNIVDDAVAVEVTNVAAIEAAADQLAAAADAGPVFSTIADTTVGTAAVLVLAANTARRRALVQNAGTTTLRIGDASVSLTRGLLLRPDGAADIETAGAIWAVSDVAGGKLAAAEVRRV